MKLKNYKNHFKISAASAFALLFLLVFHFSCQENEADEMPVKASSDVSALEGSTTTPPENIEKMNEYVGASIPLETAQRWIKNYTTKNPLELRSHFFGTKTFERLLNQQGIIGISIQYAIDDNGVRQLLLVGINADNKSLTAPSNIGFVDASNPCPPLCSEISN